MDEVRYLLIVKRGEKGLYEHAVRTFARRPYIRVIYDRREGERRRIALEWPTERRHADRRVRSEVDAAIREYGSTIVRINPA